MIRTAEILLVATALTACASPSASSPASPDRSATPQTASSEPAPSTFPAVPTGIIEPGTYAVRSGAYSAVPFAWTIPEGWVGQNGGQTVSKYPDEPRELGLNAYVITRIFADACSGTEADVIEVGPTADDLVAALLEQPGAAVAEPVEITIDGYSGVRVDLTVPADLDLSTCRPPAPGGIQIWQSMNGKYFVLLVEAVASVYVVDVQGERLVLSTQHGTTSSPEDIAEMDAIIDSIKIGE